MADGAPVSDDRARIAVDVHPASQGVAGPRDEEPAAFRAEASEELVSYRCDVGDIDRKKREPDRPSGVADQDPAVDEFPSQARGDLVGAGYLAHQRINTLAHPGSLPGRCVKLPVPSASAAGRAIRWWHLNRLVHGGYGTVPRGTTHRIGCPVTAAMRS